MGFVLKCKVCRRAFTVCPSRVGKRRHCSVACAWQHKRKAPVGSQRCSVCKRIKLLKFFPGRHPEGKRYRCRKCETRIRANSEKWKAYQREYMRTKVLRTHGKTFYGIAKRPYTGICELCRRVGRTLGYHHWDDSRLAIGLWLCRPCHTTGHWLDSNSPESYFSLKAHAEVSASKVTQRHTPS